MEKVYKAHIKETTKEIQTVKVHSENTAKLCREFSIPELKDMLYVTGLLHDIGKFQEQFQKRINGSNIKVEHSICGAMAAKQRWPDALGLMMEYCIAGHHSGIPDGGFPNDTSDMNTLYGRLKREVEDYKIYKEELDIPLLDSMKVFEFLAKDCRSKEMVTDKFAFLTRYCFSCLVDADSIDTAHFCNGDIAKPLKADFSACLKRVEEKLQLFSCETTLQKARNTLQQQVFEKAEVKREIYLMNMPTGSGKTLCSVKFALQRAVSEGKKRIIYVIPYNSIIDQTADIFEKLFQGTAEILRHQSTFSYEDEEQFDEDYRKSAKNAAENWDAPFIITTAVQFFQSIYANKRGKLRKLHNMSDSILIFDEAHLMPQDYLQPCLRAISYITRYLNSEAVFLTATMPDFSRLMNQYALPDSQILNLIEDTSLFSEFKKCEYQYIGELSEDAILAKAKSYPSTLFIVNNRATARKLFQKCKGQKYHLSTYMTAYDRKRIIKEIKEKLKELEQDFPDYYDVPEERKITIISTSLIEAGVDLDIYTVFREISGLDNILQAGGRCNREGKRKHAEVFIFELESDKKMPSQDERQSIVKGIIDRYDDISCSECITEYYQRLFFLKKDSIQKHTITRECQKIENIPFKKYADEFELIDSKTVSIVVPRDEKSQILVEKLRATGIGKSRMMQMYVCSVYERELDDLIRQHVVEDYGTGIYCLTNPDYYSEETGILFEARDYWVE
ncbi:MAG: CRISPR-associated helicase Cas3' [Hungatella sp.]|nr:CRISPR-associated helicase Cas3' [Hungatella sp.]